MNIVVSVSLRNDEYQAIEQMMKDLDLNRHQAIKLLIRRSLFPKETEHPVNDKSVPALIFKEEEKIKL